MNADDERRALRLLLQADRTLRLPRLSGAVVKRAILATLFGMALALAVFDATVAVLKISHHDQACLCVYRVGP